MKRIVSKILVAAMLIGSLVIFPSADSQAAAKPKLNKTKLTMTAGKSTKLKVNNTKKTVKWSTSNKKKATVSKVSKYIGKVKAIRAGKVTITAKAGTKKLKCIVTVKQELTNTYNVVATPTVAPTIASTVAPTIAPTVVPATPEPTETLDSGNLTYASGVTNEMCKADYWIGRCAEANDVILNSEQIATLNATNVEDSNQYMYDLTDESYGYGYNKDYFATAAVSTKDYYVDGVKIDKTAYFDEIRANIAAGGYSTSDEKYALFVKRTDIKAWPTKDALGYSVTDADDELQATAANVNEPFIVTGVTGDGKFYWGYCESHYGWVPAENVAFCKDRETWLSSWNGDDFLIVTTDKITLESSNFETATSAVMLTLGTKLSLVPADKIPANISERGTWNNYVIYVPTREEDGSCELKAALLSQHCNVNIGYLKYTSANFLKVAFECLGNRYGWGGMLNAMDCSLYTQTVYKCFGIRIPRNTTWQADMTTGKTDLTAMTDADKTTAIKNMHPGALFYFNGHTMMYVGNVGDELYVISATGSLVDSADTTNTVKSVYSVILNSLSAKRASGLTWLRNLHTAINF